MNEKKKGYRTVQEWFELIRDTSGVFFLKLNEIYGHRESIVQESANVCLKTLNFFGETFGWDREVIIVRSAGRINLLGMHIEHRGGSINPVAIKELFFVAEPRDDDIVVMRNVESNKFPDEEFTRTEIEQ